VKAVEFDTHEVTAWADAINKASAPALKDITAVVGRGALNIKKDAARRSSGLRHAPAYPRSITYDVHSSLRGPSADIGPDKNRRQGALGNLIEYGSINTAPHPHLRPAADAEEPRFAKAIEAVVEKALGIE
jgi:hypothetical protein